MRINLYTKTILTVIAVCLVWLCVGGPAVVPAAHAQQDQRVIIAGWVDNTGTVQLPSSPIPLMAGGGVPLPAR